MTIAQGIRTAVGYLRRSTDRQEQSIEDQRKAIQVWAESNDCDIEQWYIDDAISGAGTDDRKAFLKMIADAQMKDRSFEAVVVYDVKRFGRLDNDETGYYRHLLSQAGVEVIYTSENFAGDDSDDLLRPVKQWQARQELKDLSKVTIRGLLTRSEGGWWMGGMPPYGYDLAYCDGNGNYLMAVRFMPGGGKHILNEKDELQRELGPGDRLMTSKEDRARLVLSTPERVKVVQDIFRWYASEGLGQKSIADRLNRLGVTGPGRKAGITTWAMGTVRDIILNPAYTGDMVWNRKSFAKFHSIKKRHAVPAPKIKRRVKDLNDRENWIVTRDNHPPIIPRQLFDSATKKRRERTKRYGLNHRRGRGAKSNYLLTGLVTCSRCGHKWQGYTLVKGKHRVDGTKVRTQYYACGGYVTKGTSVCEKSTIHKDVIEDFLFEEIGKGLEEFLDGDAGKKMLRKALREMMGSQSGPRDARRKDKLLCKKQELEAKIYNIIDNITPTTRDFAEKRVGQLKADMQAIEGEVLELEAREERTGSVDDLVPALLEYMKEFGEVAAQGTVEEKRFLLRAFVNRVELDPEKGTGRAELFSLPRIEALPPDSDNASNPLFSMVAGAGVGIHPRPEERPAFAFTWGREGVQEVETAAS